MDEEALVQRIDRLVCERLEGLRKDFLCTQAETVSEIRKAKWEEPPKFRKKGHEEQFKFNSKILATLEEAKDTAEAAGEEEKDIEQVGKILDQGIVAVNTRQKLILLADQSELGWRTVHEYVSIPIAEDSDDENRMMKAENRAARKLKGQGKERGVGVAAVVDVL